MSRAWNFGPGSADASPAAMPGLPLPRTSLAVVQGMPRHLEAHLHRLAIGAEIMGRPVAWLLPLKREIEAWLKATAPHEKAALRLALHPGLGLLIANLEPLPEPPHPYRLALLDHPMGIRRADPSLTHKGLAGPWGVDVLTVARSLGADDALLLWPDGSLAETAIAAVGVELNGALILPPASGRVASLAERLDLPEWAECRQLRIERRDIPTALATEGRLWCMNALRGIWPATLL